MNIIKHIKIRVFKGWDNISRKRCSNIFFSSPNGPLCAIFLLVSIPVFPSLVYAIPAQCHFNKYMTGFNCQVSLGSARLKLDRFLAMRLLIFNLESYGESLWRREPTGLIFFRDLLGKSYSIQVSWRSSSLASSFHRFPIYSQENPSHQFPISLYDKPFISLTLPFSPMFSPLHLEPNKFLNKPCLGLSLSSPLAHTIGVSWL